ncbi:PEBP-like protein [Annulohypoxylon truncatum]|uniref:PEBP-like protein n=1 Tax=Annulohypoxylon truncatum TaxID=327061 RepID=UPI002007CC86|nr:PEBP-like protein [Annulohypoxylon truncatum]KAI1209502.1 PEBP-like protein [Annulohypoxylon truncatum]
MTILSIWIYSFLLATLAGATEHEQIVISPFKPHLLDSDVNEVQRELEKAEIFPTVIDKFLPSFLLNAEWSSGERTELGNTVKVDKVQNEPTITVRRGGSASSSGVRGNSNVTYTIIITDPDAPSRENPEWSEFCHFIATDVEISSSETSAAVRSSSLKDIVPYKPPGPPPKTGKHRYVFLLLAPVNGTTGSLDLSKPSDRKHWGTGKARHGVRDWAEENGLEPVAANFVYAQNEEQ